MRLVHLTLALLLTLPSLAQSTPPLTPGVLPAADVQRLMPPSVYFNGQSATVQLRNSAVFRFEDGRLVLAGLVDTSGYSTSQRDRYQFYLLTDVALEVGGKILPPGAYGCGFLAPADFLVMNLGGKDVLHAATSTDAAMTRPRPLQIIAGSSPSSFRLYLGRTYITIQRESGAN